MVRKYEDSEKKEIDKNKKELSILNDENP